VLIRNSKLSRTGLKVTAPRLRILEVFEQHKQRHLTVDDLVEVLRAQHCNMGLPTIYRVLSQLTSAGLLERNMFDWERSRATYELAGSTPHGHLVCNECGSIEEFQDAVISSRQQAVANARDFQLNVCAQILFGRCPKCRYAKGRRGRP
jgi:Fur family ferric uptake transcriptional regulator